MELIRLIFMIAIFMALSIVFTMKVVVEDQEEELITTKPHFDPIDTSRVPSLHEDSDSFLLPSKKVSRFLAEDKKPRAATAGQQCKKNKKPCKIPGQKTKMICCNHVCVDLKTNKNHCGACRKKCGKYTDTCCKGKCVNLSYNKKHCGKCNSRCMPDTLCVYGMCEYG